MKIRNYKKSDYKYIKFWWEEIKEEAPLSNMIPEDSSFIVELNNVPIMAISLFTTNSNYCLVDNFICDLLEVDFSTRREAVNMLWTYIKEVAINKGYNCLICMTNREGLVKRYMDLGFQPYKTGITLMSKELR